jgi:hypothetical protein
MRGSSTPGTPIELGSPADTAIAAARRTLAQHRRQRYPHGRNCGWCRESYPCTDRRTAEAVLYAAGGTTGVAKRAGVATVPGLSSRQRRDRSTVAQAQMMLLNSGH